MTPSSTSARLASLKPGDFITYRHDVFQTQRNLATWSTLLSTCPKEIISENIKWFSINHILSMKSIPCIENTSFLILEKFSNTKEERPSWSGYSYSVLVKNKICVFMIVCPKFISFDGIFEIEE